MQPGPIAVAEHFAMVTSHQVYVGFGQALTGVDFGSHVLPGEIHGTVFNDLDGDGQRDGDEQGMSNWRVYLDENQDGAWDATEPFEVTDADGKYTFAEVAAGTHLVGEVVQAPWYATGG